MEFFTQKHFDLLSKLHGQKHDKNNAEHETAYQELAQAYSVVKIWAEKLQQARFPDGHIKIRKAPINQAQEFPSYLWGKIYPDKNSPKTLAYTVSISVDRVIVKGGSIIKSGAVVKIDTVNLKDKDPGRLKYLEVRDSSIPSGIRSVLSIEECLKMNMEQLVEWSKNQIEKFTMDYEQVGNKTGLNQASGVKRIENRKASPNNNTSLNQILYGPPGTGKTYHTIEAAVHCAEPDFAGNSRPELQKKYDELIDEKRIRFVTFHQSYGYEEFVEGLRANSDQGQVSYDVEPGVFRQICRDASEHTKVSEDVDKSNDFEACWKELFSRWESNSSEGLKIEMITSVFTVTGFSEKSIYFDTSNSNNKYSLSINTLKGVFTGEKAVNNGFHSYYEPLAKYMKKLGSDLPGTKKEKQNYVLIIDEINRGNISKIFGELITLIEDSKRSGEGQDEALKVVLPNSGDSFTVPNNLYLIGTMNTADRSLAMMDTALRRRFDFVEMMPKLDLFNNVIIEKIDLETLLKKMNQRIEILYDREHTLGHAFFMPVKELVEDQGRAFNELKSVFKNKIIPLLAEYFFEDWSKIRLVLGDNQKAENLQFVSEEKQSFDSLFGNNHGLKNYQQEEKSYCLLPFDDDVWNTPEAYIGIYKPTKED